MKGRLYKTAVLLVLAFLTSLAGLILVLFWLVPYIYQLFETIKNLFAL